MELAVAIGHVGEALDAFGVGVIVVGMLWATVKFLLGLTRRLDGATAYREYRERVGRAILLGLEVLVAADIVRTVAIAPTLHNVAVLALIVLIRTFLSTALTVEIEGRWPWQPERARRE